MLSTGNSAVKIGESSSEFMSLLSTEFQNGTLHTEHEYEDATKSASLGEPLVLATSEADEETISDSEQYRQATGENTHNLTTYR